MDHGIWPKVDWWDRGGTATEAGCCLKTLDDGWKWKLAPVRAWCSAKQSTKGHVGKITRPFTTFIPLSPRAKNWYQTSFFSLPFSLPSPFFPLSFFSPFPPYHRYSHFSLPVIPFSSDFNCPASLFCWPANCLPIIYLLNLTFSLSPYSSVLSCLCPLVLFFLSPLHT